MTPNTQDKPPSQFESTLSVFDKVRDANPTGLLEPLGILWASTAPTPYADPSHASKIGSSGLKCTTTVDDNTNSLNAFLLYGGPPPPGICL